MPWIHFYCWKILCRLYRWHNTDILETLYRKSNVEVTAIGYNIISQCLVKTLRNAKTAVSEAAAVAMKKNIGYTVLNEKGANMILDIYVMVPKMVSLTREKENV